MSDDRDLAEEIYQALTSERTNDAAVQLWLHDLAALPVRERLRQMLAELASAALDAVLARGEAARTGHRYPPPPGENMGEPPPAPRPASTGQPTQEENYPHPLLPPGWTPKRGEP